MTKPTAINIKLIFPRVKRLLFSIFIMIIFLLYYCNLIIEYKLFTTNYLLPTIYYLLPTTNYQLPTTYYRLLTTDYLLPTTNYLLPTTNYRLNKIHIIRTHFQESSNSKIRRNSCEQHSQQYYNKCNKNSCYGLNHHSLQSKFYLYIIHRSNKKYY